MDAGYYLAINTHRPKFFDLPSQFSIMAYYKRSQKSFDHPGSLFRFLHLPGKLWPCRQLERLPTSRSVQKTLSSWLVTLLTILYHHQHQFRGNEETKGESPLCLYHYSTNSLAVSERSIVTRRTPLLPLPKLSPFRVRLRPSYGDYRRVDVTHLSSNMSEILVVYSRSTSSPSRITQQR